jgi:hypothetical protein
MLDLIYDGSRTPRSYRELDGAILCTRSISTDRQVAENEYGTTWSF